jgi:hypothetical protein
MDTTTNYRGNVMDLFFTLGSIFFAIEILHRSYDAYTIIYLKIMLRKHDMYCEDCAEQELIKEIRKK